MGYEYKFLIKQPNPDEIRAAILTAPIKPEFDAANDMYQFRDPASWENESDWPSLMAKIETDGIYLWHCGNHKFFETMVEHLRGMVTGFTALEEL